MVTGAESEYKRRDEVSVWGMERNDRGVERGEGRLWERRGENKRGKIIKGRVKE